MIFKCHKLKREEGEHVTTVTMKRMKKNLKSDNLKKIINEHYTFDMCNVARSVLSDCLPLSLARTCDNDEIIKSIWKGQVYWESFESFVS